MHKCVRIRDVAEEIHGEDAISADTTASFYVLCIITVAPITHHLSRRLISIIALQKCTKTSRPVTNPQKRMTKIQSQRTPYQFRKALCISIVTPINLSAIKDASYTSEVPRL